MRLLIDNQPPIALARHSAARGIESIHVLDVGLAESSDADIWNYAKERDLILVSKDDDFFHLAKRWFSPSAGLIWIRLGNCRNEVLFRTLDPLWPRIESDFANGDRIVEIR